MKITAGKFRGRNVESRPGHSVRPTTSRVREAAFNLLKHGKFHSHEQFIDDGQDLVEGREVVDIFCGTGILGLEALSRGAAHATLIDESSQTVDIARLNVRHIGANATVLRSDSTRLPRAQKASRLAFMDPPYHSNLAPAGLKSLAEQGWLERGAIILVELSMKEPFAAPENYIALDDREYNNTRLIVLQYHG